MYEKVTSLKKTARLAGILYLFIALTAPFALIYVPSHIIVKGDALATANNILNNEILFRTGIVSDLIGQIIFIFLVITLYKLLRQVNEYQAKLMGALVIVGVPISFLGNVFKITALMLLKGSVFKSFGPEQIHDMSVMLLNINSYGSQMLQLYWGLWLIPFGLLVYKSEFIPRILGILLIINGIAYIILSFTFILLPDLLTIVSRITLPLLFLGELPITLWFLIIGVRVKQDSISNENT